MRASGLERFVTALYESALMSPGEIQAIFDAIPEEQCPSTSEDLAADFVRRGMLTQFQADALLEGKTRGLALDSYVVLDRLGKGGMGRVFRCMHRRMKRIVALKVLPPSSMKSSTSVERFQREVEAMARLSHPNIVTAFDAGEDKGIRFLAMEYVEGSNLASLVAERGTLSTAMAVECLLQAARGLEYAHWHGMIHRDVKPGNLILNWQGTVKVLDLGIVGLVAGVREGGFDGNAAVAYEPPAVFGTPDYMAPEQAADSTSVGPACDIYSLGCTLYFLLVGRPVYSGETAEDKLRAHHEEPVPSIRASRPDVPEPLDLLFRRMLAKRPEDRPATMGDVIAELERCRPFAAEHRFREDAQSHADDLTAEQAMTVPIAVAGQRGEIAAEPAPRSRAVTTAVRHRKVGRLLVGLVGAGVLGAGLFLGLGWKGSHRGSLVIEVHEPDVAVQVMDADGEVVIDCPSAKGRLSFALSPGLYRLVVRQREKEYLAETFEIAAQELKVMQLAPQRRTERGPARP